MIPPPPTPPPLPVIIGAIEQWLSRLDEAIGEPDPVERDRLLHHLRSNIANGLGALRWYAKPQSQPQP